MNYSIGTTYEGKNPSYLKKILPYINHIEISPDALATKKDGEVAIHPDSLKQLKWIQDTTEISILIHGVGLSIGSFEGWSEPYIKLLDQLLEEIPSVKWHSEHLAYTMVNGENLGTMLTLPRTTEVVDMICRRVENIQSLYKIPFLLENVISMLPSAEADYTEAAFLNKITSLTGCGLILDVYNLQCDEANFNFSIEPFLEELDMDSVYEMHLAGGNVDEEFNFMMDVHSRVINESTFRLAKKIVDKNPINLQAITYELLEEFIPNLGADLIINELKKVNEILNHNEFAAAAS